MIRLLRTTIIFASLLPSLSAFALPEADFAKMKSELLENSNKSYVFGKFAGKDNAALGYVKFGSESGANGCLVISPGQGEAAIKALETMMDLSQKGFSPIYAIDHRGQGFSTRLLPDPQKNHVNRFSDYVDDFSTFVDSVVLTDSACQGHPMSLLAHSMGGAVAATYLERVGSASPFHKAVLSAPMLRIKYPAGKTESSVIRETWFACNTPLGPKCTDFAPGKGPFNPAVPFEGNPSTHSLARFQFKLDIFARWPETQVGGPTVQWVRQSALADKELRQRVNVWHMSTPILILQATEDKIVDNSGQDEFCAEAKGCSVERINGANHEILMETDSVRDGAISRIAEYLGSQQ